MSEKKTVSKKKTVRKKPSSLSSSKVKKNTRSQGSAREKSFKKKPLGEKKKSRKELKKDIEQQIAALKKQEAALDQEEKQTKPLDDIVLEIEMVGKVDDATEKKEEAKQEPPSDSDIDDEEIVVEEAEFEPIETESSSEKKKEKKASVDEALSVIYQNTDGSMPDMTHFKKRGRFRFFRSLFTLLVSLGLLCGVVYFALFVWSPPTTFSEQDVIVSISANESVEIGEEAQYRIRYVNAQEVSLSEATIQVRYPEGFEFVESSLVPESENNDIWAIGSLGPEESGYIDITGKVFANKGQEQSLRVFFSYVPDNFSSTFQKVATVTIGVEESPATLEVVGPERVVANNQFSLEVVMDQNKEYVGALAIEVDTAGQYSKQQSEPKSDEFYDFRWTIPDGEKNFQLRLEGSVLASESERFELPIRLIAWKDKNKNGDPFVLDEFIYTAPVAKEAVSVSGISNGSTSKLNIQPGEFMNSSVVFKNSGAVELKNVEIRTIIDAPSFENRSILDWPAIRDEADGNLYGEQQNESVRRGVITWNKTHIPALASVGQNEQQIIDFGIPIRTAEQTALANFSAHTITMTIEASYEVDGEKKIITSAPIVATINSDATLTIQSEKDVEDETEYTVRWVLNNTFHELKDIHLSAEIFGNTAFDLQNAVVPAGDIQYDEEKNLLSWSIDSMPTAVDVLPLQFELKRQEVNPSQSQLMSKVQLRAIDTVTGEEIILIGDAISLEASE